MIERIDSTQAMSQSGEFFRIAVLNDLHHESSLCDAWFVRLFEQVVSNDPELILLLGDLAHRGELKSLATIRRLAEATGIPYRVVPGNHDKDVEQTVEIYERVFPNSRNYCFTHKGWQFIGLDTTDATDANNWHSTRISRETLSWIEDALPTLHPDAPTALFTHFPLSQEIDYPFEQSMTPINAQGVLDLLMQRLNLRVALCGHFHGSTEHCYRSVPLSTCCCCSRFDHNFGDDPVKGWRLCEAHRDGDFNINFGALNDV